MPSDKGVFQCATSHTRITVKFGSDLVVGDNGIHTDLLSNIAGQALELAKQEISLLLVTSGAVKYGRLLGGASLAKTEAAFLGFDMLMQAWDSSLSELGLYATALTLTGQSLTKKKLTELKRQLQTTHGAVVANTHDGLNLSRYRYSNQASNNDVVGEKLANLCSNIYIICTNVDGVLDKNGNPIRHFNTTKQQADITFHTSGSSHGTGGMQTKLQSAIRYSQSKAGRVTYIVNGREENVLLKVLSGEEVGTRVHITEEVSNEK